MERKPQIALLIDADNAPASSIDLVLNELSALGETNIRRAYGNWTKPELSGWASILHDRAIRPMQQYDPSRVKNASDMALVVDAMSLLHDVHPEVFGIVSSDADFTPLVMHLREKGAAVYGFGEPKTPKAFRSACSRFVFIDKLAEAEPVSDASAAGAMTVKVPGAKLRQDTGLVRMLRRAVSSAAGEDGWALVSAVGQQIGNQSSFDPRNYGYVKLSALLKAMELFDVQNEGQPRVAVRERRATKQ
jgi:uncharacterized LabA/DUF88 family protein